MIQTIGISDRYYDFVFVIGALDIRICPSTWLRAVSQSNRFGFRYWDFEFSGSNSGNNLS